MRSFLSFYVEATIQKYQSNALIALTLFIKKVNKMINQTNQITDSVISADIINDIASIGKADGVDCETPYFSDGGTGLFIDTGNDFFLKAKVEYGDAFVGIHDVMDRIDAYAEQLNDTTFRIFTWVNGLDVEDKKFSCIFDLSTSKSIPQSIYDAYAYLNTNSKLSKGALLELFGAATCAICCRCIPFYIEEAGITDYYFDASEALSYDLKNNLPS